MSVAQSVIDIPDIATKREKRRKRPTGWWLWSFIGIGVLSAVGMFVIEDRVAVGGFALILMLAMIFLRMPVAIALIVPGLLGQWAIQGFRLVESSLGSAPYDEIATWSLSVVPMFILMGMLLASTGLTTNLYRAVQQWLWWLPGGLAVGTNVAGAGLAAVSGSTMATTYALGRVGIPEMIKSGYSPRIAMLAVMSSGLPGQLIPPSLLMIIYAGLAETPVGPQLLAGIGPGVIVTVVFSIMFFGIALIGRAREGSKRALLSENRVGFATMVISLLKAWPVPVLVLVITGGMLSGFFTSTEAGAAAAFIALLLALGPAIRKRTFRPLWDSAFDTMNTVGMVFFLLLGSTILSDMLTLTGISSGFASFVEDAGFNRVTFLLAMIVIYLILGTGMETLPMMALTVPVLIPTLASFDISLLWFGAFVVLLGELAILSPPVGVLIYMIHQMMQDKRVSLGAKVSLRDVFVTTTWVMPGAVLVLIIMIVWPEVSTWLPALAEQNAVSTP